MHEKRLEGWARVKKKKKGKARDEGRVQDWAS